MFMDIYSCGAITRFEQRDFKRKTFKRETFDAYTHGMYLFSLWFYFILFWFFSMVKKERERDENEWSVAKNILRFCYKFIFNRY